ncbi:MAG: endo alpha-1,4 polygalactosaminidase [Deltaproteobacteria bacterium]|nr:endo alpha-1,4 polygalactosaminidase [Deltaproteobacteria bacterium]
MRSATPAKRGYQGVFTFRMPANARVQRGAGATLRTSFHGQPASTQRWTFEVRDWVARRWIAVGGNEGATARVWTPLSFPIAGDASRLVSGAGQLQVRYSTTSAADSSDLDLLVMDLPLASGSGPGSGAGAADEPTSGLRSVFAGAFSSTPDQIDYVANVADLQITSSGASKVAQIHAANPASHNVYRYSKIAGAAPTDPHWDEVLAADLLWPGPSGQPVTQTQFGWYWLDITTPEKQAAWVAILVETLNEYLAIGYDGIYFDNVGIIDPSLINEFPADYTDAGYYADVGAVLAGMRAALPGVKFLINSYTRWAARRAARARVPALHRRHELRGLQHEGVDQVHGRRALAPAAR